MSATVDRLYAPAPHRTACIKTDESIRNDGDCLQFFFSFEYFPTINSTTKFSTLNKINFSINYLNEIKKWSASVQNICYWWCDAQTEWMMPFVSRCVPHHKRNGFKVMHRPHRMMQAIINQWIAPLWHACIKTALDLISALSKCIPVALCT